MNRLRSYLPQVPRSVSYLLYRQQSRTMVTRYTPAQALEVKTPRDPNTLSNYHNFITTHTTANLEIDFEKKRLWGNVVLLLKSLTEKEADEVVLDTRYGHLFTRGVEAIIISQVL